VRLFYRPITSSVQLGRKVAANVGKEIKKLLHNNRIIVSAFVICLHK